MAQFEDFILLVGLYHKGHILSSLKRLLWPYFILFKMPLVAVF